MKKKYDFSRNFAESETIKSSGKLKAVQFLVNEIAIDEDLLDSNKVYPIYSVYDSFEAGDALMKLLEQENAKLETG